MLNDIPLAHLAIAVNSVDESGRLYQALGFALHEAEIVAREHVRARVVEKDGLRIELLEAHPPTAGPIAKFIARRGPGLHHIALSSRDFDAELSRLQALGVQPLAGYPAAGLGGSRVAFLDPKTTGGVLFELVERKDA